MVRMGECRGGVTVGAAAKGYTQTITALITSIETMGELAESAALADATNALVAYLNYKERAGIERAWGQAASGRGTSLKRSTRAW